MNPAGINKLSLNDLLRIFIPGVYFVMLVDIIFKPLITISQTTEIISSYQAILFTIFSLIAGILISSLDLPKHMSFFKNSLPTKKVIELNPGINKLDLVNAYFRFYDNNISTELKTKTEVNNGYYHLCLNMSAISLILVIIGVCLCSYESIFYINTFLFIISSISAALLFKIKIEDNHKRQFRMFINSNEYKDILIGTKQ